jgi:hypothetical protein
MTLDIMKVAAQVGDMVAKIKSGDKERQEHLTCALEKLCDSHLNIEKLKHKIAASKGKTTWLVAGLVNSLSDRFPAPVAPKDYVVVATDGSHIDVDRNKSARYFLINIGTVVLRYGNSPDATLDSIPRLYCDENEMVIRDEKDQTNKRAIDSELLGIKRSVEECRKLVELAAFLPQGSPSLALMDGTLILWGFEAYPDFISEILLKNGYLSYFDEMRTRRLPLASYISLPRSSEVVNALRIAICPQEAPNCDRCPELNGAHACDAVEGIQDYMLFSRILGPGERSDVFFSQSKVVDKYYGENRIYFFYLRVDDEIARVEIPEWMVREKEAGWLDLTHAVVLDQCRRGQGYPVVLSEAHEQAVVTGADREEFWQLVEESLVEEKMASFTSIKSQSKRTRWI